MAKIFGITNQKGGVGKTTTAINMSACIAALNKKTLLVDMDPQGNSTSGLGVDKNSIQTTIYDCIINDANPEEAVFETNFPNLFLISSNARLVGAEIEILDLPERDKRLKYVLDAVSKDFEYIFIDSPPSLSLLTLNVLSASEQLIIPVQAEYFALEGLSMLLDTINRITENINPALTIGGIVATMYDGRTNLCQQVFDELKNHFGNIVFNTIIPRSVRFGEAPSFGKPIIYYDLKSRASESYLELAGEFIDRFEGEKK